MSGLEAWTRSNRPRGHFSSKDGMGWYQKRSFAGIAAENNFNVFLTGDRNLSFQQNLAELRLAVVVLEAKSIRLAEMLPLMPKVFGSATDAGPGTDNYHQVKEANFIGYAEALGFPSVRRRA